MGLAHRFEEMSRPMHSADGIARGQSDSCLPPKPGSANVVDAWRLCPEQPWQSPLNSVAPGVFVAPIW